MKGFTYEYKIDNRIREKYHKGFARPDNDVSHIIVHGTGGGADTESILKWMLTGGILPNGKFRKDQYRQGIALFQYIIDRDGAVSELINPHNWVYHSSTGGFDYRTIGIELVNPDKTNNGTYTDAQYRSLFQTIHFLKNIFVNICKIQGHGSIKKEKTGISKNCPGGGFDWNKLCDDLIYSKYDIEYKNGSEKIKIL